MDKFDLRKATRSLFLIESLRTGNVPYKSSFSNVWMYDKDNGKFSINTKQFKIIKQSFRNWWADGSQWPENKREAPLRGTGTEIIGP